MTFMNRFLKKSSLNFSRCTLSFMAKSTPFLKSSHIFQSLLVRICPCLWKLAWVSIMPKFCFSRKLLTPNWVLLLNLKYSFIWDLFHRKQPKSLNIFWKNISWFWKNCVLAKIKNSYSIQRTMEYSCETQNCKKVTLRENLVKVLYTLIDLRKLILNYSSCIF